MVGELNDNLAFYRMLFFQLDPEDGDRVTVAILVYHGRDVDVIYDKRFPKLRCIAPGVGPELMSFLLDSLKASLTNSDGDLELALRQHAPQVIASPERKVTWPISGEVRSRLIKRFLQPRESSGDGTRTFAEPSSDSVSGHE